VLQKKTVVAENLAAKKNVIKKECAKKKDSRRLSRCVTQVAMTL